LNARLDAHLASTVAELDASLATIASSAARGLIVMPSPFAVSKMETLVLFATKERLPAIYFNEDFAVAGGLMAYGPSIADSYRRAATHVDKILRGAKPADLPVEQPTRFALTINMKTARAIGIAVPQSLLLRADEVIQ
jgi:putative tryptophan/tyrosine transport system substrate-binding protein